MKLTFLILLLNCFATFGQVEPPKPEQPKSDSIIQFINCDAEFPGGVKALKAHIYKYFEPLTETEKSNRNQLTSQRGRVTFIVEADGSLMEIKIYETVSPEIDDQMLRMVEEMPRWTPACDENGPVRSRILLPITFFSVKD